MGMCVGEREISQMGKDIPKSRTNPILVLLLLPARRKREKRGRNRKCLVFIVV